MIEIYPQQGVAVNPMVAMAAEDRSPDGNRPYVFTNMVSSADGATAVDGLSGELAGPADAEVFRALRSVADVIIAGASTVREERYRPPQTAPGTQELRQQRGQTPKPMIAVVTASANLDPTLPLFTDPDFTPLILTGEKAPQSNIEKLEGRAKIVRVGTEGVDLPGALDALGEMGFRTALLEGGPSLNAQFLAQDLIDEWNLTLASILVGGDSKRAAQGSDPVARGVQLRRVWLADDLLFLRWQR